MNTSPKVVYIYIYIYIHSFLHALEFGVCSPSIVYIFSKELGSIELEKNMHQVLKSICSSQCVFVFWCLIIEQCLETRRT